MTVLFSGSRLIQTGLKESAVFAVPQGIKQPGIPLVISLSFDSQPFPVGITDVFIGISLDGGATFHSASMGCGPGVLFKGSFPPWVLTYQLSASDVPTHAKFQTNAPSQFTTTVTIEAL